MNGSWRPESVKRRFWHAHVVNATPFPISPLICTAEVLGPRIFRMVADCVFVSRIKAVHGDVVVISMIVVCCVFAVDRL